MNIEFYSHEHLHQLGESATRLIEQRCSTLAALLLLVGISPLHRRVLPARRIAAHSGASNCRI